MIDFLPVTPFPVAGTVALFLTCCFALWRDRAVWPVAAVMLANWVATRAVTAWDLPGAYQAVADSSAAVLLLFPQHLRASLALPVSALFALMVAFSAVNDLGLIGRDTLWAWSDVLGYCQLLLILGATADFGRGRRRAVADRHRRRDTHMGGAVAGRVQVPPHP
jgi:hypothetical protein